MGLDFRQVAWEKGRQYVRTRRKGRKMRKLGSGFNKHFLSIVKRSFKKTKAMNHLSSNL